MIQDIVDASTTDDDKDPTPAVHLSITRNGKGYRTYILRLRKGNSGAGEIIAQQEIDLFYDHLPTVARTLTTFLRGHFTVHLDSSIEAILS